MKRRDVLAGHAIRISRRDTGARHRGGYHTFATVVSCECGWTGAEIPEAPSLGGRLKAITAHQEHIDSLLCRDAQLVMMSALTGWRNWCPGDGVTYRIKVCGVEGGAADSDRILLVNCGWSTWSFQYPYWEFRRQELIAHGWQKMLGKGVPPKIWTATVPLLEAVGVI